MSHELFIEHVFLKRDQINSYDAFPFCVPAVRNLQKLDVSSPVTFFIGENGTGKTTLLEGIALVEGFNREGGSRNLMFASRKEWKGDDLAWALGVGRPMRRIKGSDGYFFRAESFYNVATEIERLEATHYYGGKSLHDQSHGEAFLALFATRFIGNGLYLLDEPEAALSPQRQLMFLAVMRDLVERGSQFIIATHSPIILGYPDAVIYQFTESGIEPIAYEDTPHVRVTHSFLTRREKMLEELFREESP